MTAGSPLIHLRYDGERRPQPPDLHRWGSRSLGLAITLAVPGFVPASGAIGDGLDRHLRGV